MAVKEEKPVDYGISHDQVGFLFDWKLQYHDVKGLIISGKDEEFITDLSKKFGRNNFEYIIFTNLKNNSEIREYINEHEPGRDMLYFLEKALADMIVPVETMLIFNNAHTCEGIWKFIKYLHDTDSDMFVALTGDFSDEQIEAAKDYTMSLKVEPLSQEEK